MSCYFFHKDSTEKGLLRYKKNAVFEKVPIDSPVKLNTLYAFYCSNKDIVKTMMENGEMKNCRFYNEEDAVACFGMDLNFIPGSFEITRYERVLTYNKFILWNSEGEDEFFKNPEVFAREYMCNWNQITLNGGQELDHNEPVLVVYRHAVTEKEVKKTFPGYNLINAEMLEERIKEFNEPLLKTRAFYQFVFDTNHETVHAALSPKIFLSTIYVHQNKSFVKQELRNPAYTMTIVGDKIELTPVKYTKKEQEQINTEQVTRLKELLTTMGGSDTCKVNHLLLN